MPTAGACQGSTTRRERAVICAASESAVAAAGAQWALGGSGRAGDAMPSASTNVSVVTELASPYFSPCTSPGVLSLSFPSATYWPFQGVTKVTLPSSPASASRVQPDGAASCTLALGSGAPL